MSTDEEKSKKPRQLIHRVQAECIRALDAVRRSRVTSVDDETRRQAEHELHNAVMLYWEQVKRFRGAQQITEEWQDEAVFDDVTLADLEEKRLTYQQTTTTRTDPDTGTTETVQIDEPWQLSPREAVQVLDQLDDCANELGFDAQPAEGDRDTYTAVKRPAEQHREPVKDGIVKPES